MGLKGAKAKVKARKNAKGKVASAKAKLKAAKKVAKKDKKKVKKAKKKEKKVAKKEKKVVKKAKKKEKKAIKKGAKKAEKKAKKSVNRAKKKVEIKTSLAGGTQKKCKKLVPPTKSSKDQASLCSTIKKENHCIYFDYARYCGRSCGSCVV